MGCVTHSATDQPGLPLRLLEVYSGLCLETAGSERRSTIPPVPPPKRHPYDQWSPDARALDLVGDKWTLLIVRDLAAAYAGWGLAVTAARPATPADVAAAHSTWGKRLGAGGRRPAWLLRARLDRQPAAAEAWTAGRRSSTLE